MAVLALSCSEQLCRRGSWLHGGVGVRVRGEGEG